MSNPKDLQLDDSPANISNVILAMPTIQFDTIMQVKNVKCTKGIVELTVTLVDHPVETGKSIYGTETGEGSVGGMLIYADKNNQLLSASVVSVQQMANENEPD